MVPPGLEDAVCEKKKSVGDAPKFNWAKSIFSFGWGNGRAQKGKKLRDKAKSPPLPLLLFSISRSIYFLSSSFLVALTG